MINCICEDKDSPYVNIIVSRTDNKDSKESCSRFRKSYQTEEVYQKLKNTLKMALLKGW